MSKLTLTVAFILILGTAVNGQITTTPTWTGFASDVSTYNGQPLAVGTIIKAYDPDNVLCGIDTVRTEGLYGYMSVYGDDVFTLSIDEGAEPGDIIHFEINGRPATATGDATFTDRAQKQVQLVANGNIAFTLLEFPEYFQGNFSQTIRYKMKVRNDGDGTDFYGVDAISSYAEYTIEPQADTVYAEPGEIVTVFFDITTPNWPPNQDTVNVIDFTVYSLNDPSVSISEQTKLYFTITDVKDDYNQGLPAGFTLQQNYPNPFNPTTTIAYSLPLGSKVELQVVNVLGQTVDIINMGHMSSGDHEIYYDASALTSGVYFYRIVTENSVQTRKMVLMK